MTWQDKIRNPHCTECSLHEGAQHVCLMGTGSRKSAIAIVGEAPGAREDDEHAAFVGPAGKLLTDLLNEVGISRDEVYITNVVKCRPPGNETPTRSQAKVCGSTYLAKEMGAVAPDFVLSLGNTALQGLTGRSGITKYRGKIYKLGGVTVFPTFHPAAALRSPRYLPQLRSDLATFARLCHGDTTRLGSPRTKVRIAQSASQVNWIMEQVDKSPAVSFDLETSGLEEWREGAGIATLGVSWAPGHAAVIPIHHPSGPWSDNPQRILRRAKASLERHPFLVGHNGKFDARWLAEFGIFVHVAFDTMVAAHVLDENRPKGLKPLSQLLLGASDYDIGDDVKNAMGAPLKRLCVYNAIDCDYTLQLYYLFKDQLEEEPRLQRLFRMLMMPASEALTQIERGGMLLDHDKFVSATKVAEGNIEKLKGYMDAYLPENKATINYNSPQQVGTWLFEDLGLGIVEHTRTGAPSTREGVLFALEKEHKAVKALLKYRKWHKFLSTYLYGWQKRVDQRGRLHTNYRLTGTVTGRLSSADPNLQQVPRDPFIRSIIGSPKGWVFAEADYSQVELRVVAFLSNETTMLRLLAQGVDLHYATASSIIRKRPEDITKDERVIWGKHPNFGLIYGLRPQGYEDYCANNGHEISASDADRAHRIFHETYPRIARWHDRQRRLVHRYGRVSSAIGRVRHLPDIESSDESVRKEAERQAINSPAQSLASDLMLISLVRLHSILPPTVARIVGTTHDALKFEIREKHVDTICGVIRETMEDMEFINRTFGSQITVPIETDITVGTHWGEGHDWSPV